ncbi:hypothetical protein ACN38_g5636 [Penicillium nordicum]|uniref:Uncharacterized protein n=1 Tax=Penicillium nordicum TaxID=229535 RepID=A0A0M9WG06_9EURO|nr:hypothetical protein ACN38_g5636 [Penicillium nordicum]
MKTYLHTLPFLGSFRLRVLLTGFLVPVSAIFTNKGRLTIATLKLRLGNTIQFASISLQFHFNFTSISLQIHFRFNSNSIQTHFISIYFRSLYTDNVLMYSWLVMPHRQVHYRLLEAFNYVLY